MSEQSDTLNYIMFISVNLLWNNLHC